MYRSLTTTGFTLLAQVDASTITYVDQTVTNGTTYYYVVTSVYDEDNESN